MKKPFEMTFAEFYEAAKPTCAANRLPEMNHGLPVHSYAVFLNGAIAADLAQDARNHKFPDTMVTASARNLGMNPRNLRDNMKVCELTAARFVWMTCVSMEQSRNRLWGLDDLPGDTMKEYEALNHVSWAQHPFVQSELRKQKNLTNGLQPLLDEASKITGKTVVDVHPDVVSVGKVVSQTLDFLVQETTDGEYVTHESSRLASIPKTGAQVTVSYYRGSGQVVDSLENVRVSSPYIDDKTNDLAIKLTDGAGKEQVVLFNDEMGVFKFVRAHNLDRDLIRQALVVRENTPKISEPLPTREAASSVYLDANSGCLAIDYIEKDVRYTAMFSNSVDLESQAKIYGLKPVEIERGKRLELERMRITPELVSNSLTNIEMKLGKLGVLDIADSPRNGVQYEGKVLEEAALHVAQDLGRKTVVIHDKRVLDKLPAKGDHLSVTYENGLGKVSELKREQGAGLGR